MPETTSTVNSKVKSWLVGGALTFLGFLGTQTLPFLKPYFTLEAIGGYFKTTWAFIWASSAIPNWVTGIFSVFALVRTNAFVDQPSPLQQAN